MSNASPVTIVPRVRARNFFVRLRESFAEKELYKTENRNAVYDIIFTS